MARRTRKRSRWNITMLVGQPPNAEGTAPRPQAFRRTSAFCRTPEPDAVHARAILLHNVNPTTGQVIKSLS